MYGIQNLLQNSIEINTTDECGEMDYLYDGSQIINASNHELEDNTEFILQDGTRAMIINGALVTSDGQALVLNDEDINGYNFDETSDQIVISDEHNELFQAINGHIISNDDQPDEQQQVYFLEGSDIPFALNTQNNNCAYQLATFSDESTDVPLQMVQLDSATEESVIDLGQILQQDDIREVEEGSYQCAVLKNGMIHFQPTNHIYEINNLPIQSANNSETVIEEPTFQLDNKTIDDLSSIKGRNLLTGQPITLTKYLNKIQNTKFKDIEVKRKIKVIDNQVIVPREESPIKKLINKKIPLFRTSHGKLMVGKIVDVIKKNTVPKTTVTTSSTTDNKCLTNFNQANKRDIEDDRSILQSLPIQQAYSESENIHLTDSLKSIKKDFKTCKRKSSGKSVIKKSPSLIENRVPFDATIKKDSPPKSTENNQKDNLQGHLIANSNIVIQDKVVSKDCFSLIAKTLSGLMNMDSVVKKLKDRPIILKVLEKNYNQDKKEYEKNVSYCSGYMVREYKLDDEADSFSESWTFVPDSNPKDIILNGAGFETTTDTGTGLKPVNITIQITVNSEGNRTSRVIISPLNMYGNIQSLIMLTPTNNTPKSSHFVPKSSSVDAFNCKFCPMKFSHKRDLSEHITTHIEDSKESPFQCDECNKKFVTALQLGRHMQVHFKPVQCKYCSKRYANLKELKKHLTAHFFLKKQNEEYLTELPTVAENKQQTQKKVFSCDFCSRQFTRHSNLQRHTEIHSGDGAFKCTVCSCSYQYGSSLTRHMLSDHLDITKRSHSLKVEADKELDSLIEYKVMEDDITFEAVPLYEMGETMQFQNVNIDMEHLPGDMEILEIPIDENIIIEN
ncbi:uncharacterized protein LOC115876951 [Sitophilus oryzae]|uniref:Uncharacterized protein LOC115876951 n=1 Tax=Sitophilus oryzae TaxID=7048 RepID=A0A6J2XC89_SITOR|nr:uncharacterized protein LOC115876951 [Sitophilus oryzae]XP_030748948.1 uncharacterized protein LOC115876951 [Sitophilus oryzae]XP_030749024.1 uncharacterized protein LOC115876951 [Sitophilus oryzae]